MKPPTIHEILGKSLYFRAPISIPRKLVFLHPVSKVIIGEGLLAPMAVKAMEGHLRKSPHRKAKSHI